MIQGHDLRDLKSKSCAAFSGIFPCGGGIKIQRSDSTESHEDHGEKLVEGCETSQQVEKHSKKLVEG